MTAQPVPASSPIRFSAVVAAMVVVAALAVGAIGNPAAARPSAQADLGASLGGGWTAIADIGDNELFLYHTDNGNAATVEVAECGGWRDVSPLADASFGSGWTHVVGPGNGALLFYDAGSGALATGAIGRTGDWIDGEELMIDAGWTHVAAVGKDGVLFYDEGTGRAVGGVLDGGAWIQFEEQEFQPGWTHVAGNPVGGLVFYDAATGVVWTGAFDGHEFVLGIDTLEPAPFASAWTGVVGVGDGFVFYDGEFGAGATAVVREDGMWDREYGGELPPGSFPAGAGVLAGFWFSALFYDPTTEFGYIGYFDDARTWRWSAQDEGCPGAESGSSIPTEVITDPAFTPSISSFTVGDNEQIVIRGEGFTVGGRVELVVRSLPSGDQIDRYQPRPTVSEGFAGGSFDEFIDNPPLLACDGEPDTRFEALDRETDQWSNPLDLCTRLKGNLSEPEGNPVDE